MFSLATSCWRPPWCARRSLPNLYRDAGSPWPARIGPVGFEGIFEIGPVDGQTSRILNADGTAWNVLLPMCDGDVFNLQGVRPFDRMLLIRTEVPATPKSTVIFILSAQDFAALVDGAPITVQYGAGHDAAGWRFGRINKGQLAK